MKERLDFALGTIDDLNDIFQVVDITGWGETKDDIQEMISNPYNKYILLVSPENEIIAVTLTVAYDKIGFIGHVIVLPEFRGMGIGEEIMREAINYLKNRGCKTIKLDAVLQAKTLYERVGFQFETNSLRYKLDLSSQKLLNDYLEKKNKFKKSVPTHHTKEDDLAEIFNIDDELFGCDRRFLLMNFFKEFPQYSFIIRDKEDYIKGYSFGIMRNERVYIRAAVSDSFEATVNLIDASITVAQEYPQVKTILIGMTENTNWGIKTMEKLGFEKTSYSLRMYWGETNASTTNPAFFAIGHPAKG